MLIKRLLPICFMLFIYTVAVAQVVNNQDELDNAIASAAPGSTIVLADGIWNDVFIDIDKVGTAGAPITITAQNQGAVLMTGNSRVYMEGAYLTLQGLVFQDPANLNTSGSTIKPVIELKRCDYCRVLENKIDSFNGTESQKSLIFKWILTDGQYNEIAYNSFVGKYGIGSIINDNRITSEPDYLLIHHNYFADRTPINEVNEDNDQDAIRIGNSSTSLQDSYTQVYNNYFYNFAGEVEVISNKSGQNRYYNNTFRNYSGTLTLRHGDNCEVNNNYFIAENRVFSGGIRVIGEGHKVYNNYIEGINSRKPDGSLSNATGGINVSNGREDSELNGYFQVKNTEVVNNTLVNCDYALRVGTTVSSDLSLEPVNLIVANNITYNTSEEDYQIKTEPSGNSISEGNILGVPMGDMENDGNFFRVRGSSSPIDAGLGSYPYLSKDILGGDRDASIDAGAEEFGANGVNLPYNSADVGVSVGFGATASPTLSLVPGVLTFGKYSNTKSVDIVANVDWTIVENVDWLSLDLSSGSGRMIVKVTVDDNTLEQERSADIIINEVSGGGGLSTTLTIIQSDQFIPIEIPIVATTSKGMQDKEDIKEENAYDDDLSTYWTGDPDSEPEVSITFDLSCLHVLTDIGINFWKADERTTTFSISISNEQDGLFTTLIDSETSAASGAFVETEQYFSLNSVVARYVKFTGIGNSSSSNWTSIANVNIYGDLNCETPVNVIDTQAIDANISVFPNPVSEGQLTIESTSANLNTIEIFNINGQKVLTAFGGKKNKKQVDVSSLGSGVYIIKLEGLGYSKMIIE